MLLIGCSRKRPAAMGRLQLTLSGSYWLWVQPVVQKQQLSAIDDPMQQSLFAPKQSYLNIGGFDKGMTASP
ncbi:hypothetical protein CXQ82_14375 [Pseudomonas sp. S09G 359]|nr:hypothetical protein CXQ82_14375 [Pseudomonas sp. S09G 359]